MKFFRAYMRYIKDNPEGYWFKPKLFGWGWTPVRWQGFVVIALGIFFILMGVRIGDADDSPGMALLGLVLALVIIFGFCFWKGEKPRWQWGIPEKYYKE